VARGVQLFKPTTDRRAMLAIRGKAYRAVTLNLTCHDGRVAIVPGTPISRRSLFVGAAGLGASVLISTVTGCSYFGGNEPAAPTVEQTPAALDPINGLIATTNLHLLRLDAAIAADQADAARLTPLRDDRAAQLAALEAEFARTNPSVSQSGDGSGKAPPPAMTLPDSPEEIISAVRGDAATAQVQFTDAISSASRYRAAMFGSIAAALASHRAVLA
jgi:hypothetical protein